MKGKKCVVTGANTGIGFETSKALASKGAEVIMVCRNEAKGRQALAAIREATGNHQLQLITADLSSQRQIREMAFTIREQHPVIDVLVNNAGTWVSDHSLTEDGIETVFAVNHLAYFLLTHLLYPAFIGAADARVINVSSDSHFKGDMYFDDLNLTRNYHGLRSYGQSKLANVLFTYEFDRRKPHAHVSINAVQPGLVYTDIGLKNTNWVHALAWKVRRSLWRGVSPAEGAATSIYLASDPEISRESGKYWDKCQAKASSPDSYKEEDAGRLWEICERLCSIDDYFITG